MRSRFTQSGSVSLKIVSRAGEAPIDPETCPEVIRSSCHSSVVNFAIEDTGPGIATHELAKLFKPFEQTRTGLRSLEGTGLGLAISQKFVQLMGGKISAVSQVGVGSTFSFDLPVKCGGTPSNHPAQAIQSTEVKLAPKRSTYRILIAEDDVTNRLLLSRMLSWGGFELKEAIDGEAAVRIWRDWQPHLILMDMRMPRIDGLEATRRIKADPRGENTVIIALTASAFEEQRQAFMAIGCDDFVRKPFQFQDLAAKVSQHLGIENFDHNSLGFAPNTYRISGDRNSLLEPTSVDLRAILVELPAEWQMQLHDAAAQGDDLRILKLLQVLPVEQRAFVEGITQLATNFQFDQITNLIQHHLVGE